MDTHSYMRKLLGEMIADALRVDVYVDADAEAIEQGDLYHQGRWLYRVEREEPHVYFDAWLVELEPRANEQMIVYVNGVFMDVYPFREGMALEHVEINGEPFCVFRRVGPHGLLSVASCVASAWREGVLRRKKLGS